MKTLNLVFQVDESQHLSEERVVINYIDDAGLPLTKIVTYSELSAADKTKYTTLKNLLIDKI